MQARLALSFFSLFAVTLPLAAQSTSASSLDVPPVNLLPAHSYAAASFGGLAAAVTAARSMPMARLVEHMLGELPTSARDAFFEEGLAMAASELRRELRRMGVSAADLRALLSRPMALGLGRLTVQGLGPSVALVVDLGDAAAAAERSLTVLGRQLPAPAVSPAPVADCLDLRQFGDSQDMPPLLVAKVGSGGRYLVLTNSRGYLREIAAVASGKATGLQPLPQSASAGPLLPAPALLGLSLETSSLGSMLAPHLPYEAEDFAAALGLGGFAGAFLGCTATSAGGCDAAYLAVGGSRSGLVKALVGQPVDLSFASLCSANTVLFGSSSLDMPAVIDAFGRLLDLLPVGAGSSARSELHSSLAAGFGNLGASPEQVEQVLRAFGTQLSFAVSLEQGVIPKPELLLRVAVKQADAVRSMLPQLEEMLAAAAGVEWKSRQVDGQDLRFCSLPLHENLQLTPCYVLRGTDLLFGSDVQAMVRALRQPQRPLEALTAQPDFQALQQEALGASGVLHLRLFRAADLGWRAVEQWVFPWLDQQSEEMGFGSEVLPDAELMAAALATSTYSYRVDDHGFLLRGRGTLTFGSVVAGLGTLLDRLLELAAAPQ